MQTTFIHGRKHVTPIQPGRIVLQLVLGFILLSGTIFAGEIQVNSGKTEFRMTTNTYKEISFSVTISSIQYRNVLTKRGLFDELFVQGYGYRSIVGEPKLPVFHKLIEIPLNANFSIQITKEKYQEYDLSSLGITNPIIPTQASVSKNIIDPNQLPFILNADTYQMNKWLGGPLVKITPEGILRSLNLAQLKISPVWYNPVNGKIRVYEILEVKVLFTNADVPSTIQLKRQTYSPYFSNLYARIINNKLIPDTLITNAPVTYVIIADSSFHDALQPFIAWKKKKGFHVIVGYTNNPAVGETNTSIKSYLQGLYDNPPIGYQKPSFVLFAGDIGQIPPWMTDGHPSDMYYCDYTGDNIPDVFYGRFAAQNVTQLQTYIDKTLEYEQYTMPSDAFLGEVTMVAGSDATNGPLYGNGQINYGDSNYFNSAHHFLSHTYLQPEPTGGNYAVNIHQNVSNGVAFANYTAHGSENGWADPEFLISDIDPLQNNHKYCLMIGNCCKTSNYSVDCFAKEVTRTANKGALGYIGCSDYSYWDEDYWWACGYKAVSTNPPYDPQHLGAYDVTFHDKGENLSNWFVTMGQMVAGGQLAVQESSSGMKLYYWETYCLMGDPSLSVYYSIPQPVSASYPTLTYIGTNSLRVTTEPYAYVALTLHDTVLLSAQCADTTGIVNLTFDPLVSPDSLSIVITKQNRKPHIGNVLVVPATGPYVLLTAYSVHDSLGGDNIHTADYGESIQLTVAVKNIGLQNASAISGRLSTSDTNVTITSGSFNFGPISSGETITGKNAYALTVNQDVQDQHPVQCNLLLTNDTATWTSNLILILNAPILTGGSVTILDTMPGGNNNGVLEPGESATLRISAINAGHATSPNTIARLTVPYLSAPYISVSNPSYYLGSLAPGGLDYSYFPVMTNAITPNGTSVDLNYAITGGSLNQFSGLDTINLTIGKTAQYNMKNDTITTCNGKFYDSGGPDSNYSDNENYICTFIQGASGSMVKAVFNAFNVEDDVNCGYDWLKVFNGPDISSPLLGTYCGSNIPGPFISTTGPLTFQFSSDYSVNLSGWEADISCAGGPLSIAANAFPENVCTGNTTQMVAIPSGGAGHYSYLWSPATYLDDPTIRNPISTPLANITYTVTVYDGNTNLTSNVIPLIVHSLPSTPVITFNSGSLISSSSSNNQWYLNDALIPGATGSIYIPTATGRYNVIVLDPTSNCTSMPSNSIYYPNLGIDQSGLTKMVSIYPNPFRDNITISYELGETGNVVIILYDECGKELRIIQENTMQTAGKYKIEMSAGNLNNGVYLIKVQTFTYTVTNKILLIH